MARFQRLHPARPACPSRREPLRSTTAAVCLALLVAPAAQAQSSAAAAPQHAHVHGVARLGVVVQDTTVSITFESPLDSLIGFEHRPTTPAQQLAADALRARMRAGAGLFAFDPGAGCSLAKADAESAIFASVPGAGAADGHADLDASFEFRCARPERLAQLDVALFAVYPRLQRLEVEVVTDRGQFKRELKSPARTVALTR
jgi:hypothetical protein